MHPSQARAVRAILDRKRTVIRAGRRWGKSTILIALASDEAIRGRPVGYFCPLFRIATPVFDALALVLGPLRAAPTGQVGKVWDWVCISRTRLRRRTAVCSG